MEPPDKTKNDACDNTSKLPKSQDGGWGWVVVFSSFMIYVICGGLIYTFSIFLQQFMEEFKETKAKTSLISSLMIGACCFVGPVAGYLTRNLSCRKTAMIGSLLAAFGLGTSVLATNATFLIFTAGLCTGIGFGFMFLPSVVCITFYFEKKRAFATAIAVSGTGIGNFILPPFIQWMLDLMGWRSSMLVTTGLVLSCSIFSGALRMPLEERNVKERKSSMSLTHSEEDPIQLPDTRLVKNIAFLVFVFSALCTTLGLYTPYVFFQDRVIRLRIADATETSYLLSILGILNTFGSLLFGFLSDRPWINTLWLYGTGITLCGLVTAISTLCTSYISMALYAAVFGVTAGAYMPLIPIILGDLVGADRLTVAFGLTKMFEGAAAFIGPTVTGWLFDCFGSYKPGFLLCGIIISVSGMIAMFIPYYQRKQKLRDQHKEPTQIEISTIF